MLTFEFNLASTALPGYLGLQRLLGKAHWVGGAWDELDLYRHQDAEEFLKERIKKLMRGSDPDDLVSLCMGFAVTAVMADRENRGEYATEPLPAEALSPEEQIEAAATEKVQF